MKIDIPDNFSNDTFLKKLDNLEKISTFSSLHLSSLNSLNDQESNQLRHTLDRFSSDKERMSYIYLMTQDIYDLCLMVLKFNLVSDRNINLFILNKYLSNEPKEEKLETLINNVN